MKVLIIDNGSEYIGKLVGCFGGMEVEVLPFNSPSLLNSVEVDLLVLSGGHLVSVVDHADVYAHEIDFLKSLRVPILGICLGSEILGVAFGAHIRMLGSYQRGVSTVKVVKEDIIFKNIPQTFKVYENHRNIVDEIPEELIPLAISSEGVEIFKHRDRPIYGIQFHPEMFVEIGEKNELLNNFVELAKK